MDEMPGFLPPILDLQGTWEEILERLYTVFCRDFKKGTVYHRGMRILYDSRILPDGSDKEEGFWHVVSKVEPGSGERLIDYRRAERLPWARPTMESDERPEIRIFVRIPLIPPLDSGGSRHPVPMQSAMGFRMIPPPPGRAKSRPPLPRPWPPFRKPSAGSWRRR